MGEHLDGSLRMDIPNKGYTKLRGRGMRRRRLLVSGVASGAEVASGARPQMVLRAADWGPRHLLGGCPVGASPPGWALRDASGTWGRQPCAQRGHERGRR